MGWNQSEAGRNDRQQQECYAAEKKVNWQSYQATERLEDLHDVWVFTNRLLNRKSFARRYFTTHCRLVCPPKTKPRKFGHGHSMQISGPNGHGLNISPHSRAGSGSKHEISLAKYARQKWIIVHELAHVVDWNENGMPEHLWHQGHGWQFCAIYLNLTSMAFGVEAQKELRQAFKDGNVKYTKPSKGNQRPNDPDPDRNWVV
tara:strand:+ start:3207 stop:3812 length:606 start_codon:yes stop_codon:yes gene_type:complete